MVPSAEMSAFGCGGSDALVLRRAHVAPLHARPKILKFEGSYNGWYDGLLFSVTPDLAAAGPMTRRTPVAESGGMSPETARHITLLQYNDEAAVEKLFAAHGHEYACVIVEPVMHGAGVGVLEPRPSFLPFLRGICTRYGVALVFDEILTGFRHDIGGAPAPHERHARPDRLRQGDVQRLPDLRAVGQAGVHVAHVAAGTRVLLRHVQRQHHVRRRRAQDHRAPRRRHGAFQAVVARQALRRRRQRKSQRLGLRVRARHYGSMVTVHFTDRELFNYRESIRNHDKALNRAFVDWVNDRGLYTKPRRVNRFAISTAHTEDDIDRSVEIVEGFLTAHKSSLS